jgi:hypothetical protein
MRLEAREGKAVKKPEENAAYGHVPDVSVWKTIVSVTLAAALGAGGVLVLTKRATPASVSNAETATSVDPRNEREIGELRRRLARLEAKQSAVATAAAAVPVASPSADDPAQRDPAIVAREQAIARWMETNYTTEVQGRVFGHYFGDVDKVRLAEAPDTAWVTAQNRDLRQLLEASADIGATIEHFDCGSTLCRMQLTVQDFKRRGNLLHEIQRSLHFDEASAFMPSNDTKLDACLAREGSTLPLFDQMKYVSEEMK